MFDLAVGNDLSPSSVDEWLGAVDLTAGSYRTLRDRDALLIEYQSLLSKASVMELDPLMMATFDILTGSIMDTLVKMEPAGNPITGLIDSVTDVHLEYIEEFCNAIDDGGSEGYSQSSNQEFLAYQHAGLVFRTYSKISRGLGSDYDTSTQAIDMRTNSWVSTVYARLQRRFVRFLAANVEEIVEEQNAASFERVIGRMKVDVVPKYSLSKEEAFSGTGEEAEYPAWKLTASLIKIIRNIITEEDMERLEPSLSRQFQNEISVKMRSLSRPLAAIAAEEEDKYAGKMITSSVNTKQAQQLDDFLQSGHESVAAVLSLWQVRHNIVGVPDSEGKVVKDYLRGVSFAGADKMLEAIPQKVQKEGVLDIVQQLELDLSADGAVEVSDGLRSAAVLAHAIRSTASDDFRSLITYNADTSDIPASRDELYSLLLRSVVESALDPSAPPKSSEWVHENLVAVAALEETVGVREPRAACVGAYQAALLSVCQGALANVQEPGGAEAFADLSARAQQVEAALVLINRLPADVLGPCRTRTFKAAINSIMDSVASEDGTFAGGRERVEADYPRLAALLRVPLETAQGFIAPLGQERFDKAVGRVLMNADLVLGKEEEGRKYRDSLMRLAGDVMMPAEVAQQRVLLLGGVVVESMVEAALEEHRRMNEGLAEAALKKAGNLQRHPLWAAFEAADGGGKPYDVAPIASKMVVSRLGLPLVSEVLRMLEAQRKRQSGVDSRTDAGWGSATVSEDAGYTAFLERFQEVLMSDYSEASMK